MQKIKQGLIKIVNFLKNNLGDILIFLGILTICFASFFVNIILGLYVTGFSILGFGLFFSKYPLEKR